MSAYSTTTVFLKMKRYRVYRNLFILITYFYALLKLRDNCFSDVSYLARLILVAISVVTFCQ